RPNRPGLRRTRNRQVAHRPRRWRSASAPSRICACATSARPITRTAHCFPLSTSSAVQRVSRATIHLRPSWKNWKPYSPARHLQTRMWPSSRELLDLAVEHVRSLPLLLVVTFRPEFQPPWTGQAQVSMLALNRLDRRDRTALVTQIAGGKVLP